MSDTDTALPPSAARLFALAEKVTGFMPADEGRTLHVPEETDMVKA